MEVLLNDLKVAVRRLVRDPRFAVVAILTLAIGIGANSAIVTLVNGVLLQQLPYRDAGKLVFAHAVLRGEPILVFSGPVFAGMRDQGRAFDGVAMFAGTGVTIAGEGEPELVSGSMISANYFDVVGVAPLRGRVFRDGENQPGGDMVVLLSEGIWRERYGADEGIVGRTVEINGRPREVVGIMPEQASFPRVRRLWLPQPYEAWFTDPGNALSLGIGVIARLKPAVTTVLNTE